MLGESPVWAFDIPRFVSRYISDKGKPREIWGRKTTDPETQDSRVAEEMMMHLERDLAKLGHFWALIFG